MFDVAWVWRPVRPVLRYLVVMAVVVCVAYVLPPLLSGWIGGGGWELRDVFWSKTVFLLVAAGVAGLLVTGFRMTPTEAFLARGNMAAPSRVRLPGTSRPVSWAVLGTVAAAALFALMATVTWLQSGLEPAALERLVPLLPLVIGCAAFNSLGEEVVYRPVPSPRWSASWAQARASS